MATLNRIPAAVALRYGVQAVTDVTGFGLAGHAAIVARESHVSLELRLADLPLLPGSEALALAFQPAGLKANRRQFEPLIHDQAAPDEVRRALLFDPQTSGGLLLLVPEAEAAAVLAELPAARAIGRARPRGDAPLALV
jgi:selenide,water dikinase